jgi:hypothetical protein
MPTTIEYWGFTQIAEHTGLKSGNLRFMAHKGKLPKPDVKVGLNPGWRPNTIRKWWAARTADAAFRSELAKTEK